MRSGARNVSAGMTFLANEKWCWRADMRSSQGWAMVARIAAE